MPCSRRWRTPTTGRWSPSSRCASCRARARRRSCCTAPASTRRRSPPRRARSVRFVADDLVRRELLGGVDAAQERAARLAGGLYLRLREVGAADRAGLLERVFEGALFEVHDALYSRSGSS